MNVQEEQIDRCIAWSVQHTWNEVESLNSSIFDVTFLSYQLNVINHATSFLSFISTLPQFFGPVDGSAHIFKDEMNPPIPYFQFHVCSKYPLVLFSCTKTVFIPANWQVANILLTFSIRPKQAPRVSHILTYFFT